MKLLSVLALAGVIVVQGVPRPALRATKLSVPSADLGSYSFAQFIQDFGRDYVVGTKEYQQRAGLFRESLEQIRAKLLKNAREGASWTAGVHEFMDWTTAERQALQGYKPSRIGRTAGTATVIAGLQLGNRGSSQSRLNSSLVDSFLGGEGAHYRNQGNCGSCWAISAVEAVESQLKRSGQDVRLSAQALIDCVPNPQHCGGKGGCDGATGELAYNFMQTHGIPLESDLAYTAQTGTCRMDPSSGTYPTQRRAMLSGWESLPSNQAMPLQQALVQDGSVVVAVDGNEWFDYSSGVFDGCQKDATLGHAVLAKGFGKDQGKKYWTIQNSWGRNWGENGDIRLLRHENDDEWCGIDSDPQEGLGCDGGPPTIRVCGMCGVLYDSLVPQGARIDDDATPGSMARANNGDYTPWTPESDFKPKSTLLSENRYDFS